MKKEAVVCPICKRNDYEQALDQDRYNMGLKTVICNSCGFIFTNPRPIQEEMKHFYETTYRQFYTGADHPERDYLENSSRYVRAQRIFSFVRPFLIETGMTSPSVLDVGCGSGILLHFFREYSPTSQLYGIEPGKHYAEFAGEKNQAEIFHGEVDAFISRASQIDEPCDIITLNHVLEHLYNPVERLIDLRLLIKGNGLLLIEVPNLLSPDWTDKNKIFHIAHISHFTTTTLRRSIRTAGFEVLKYTTDTPRVMTFLCKKIERTVSLTTETAIPPSELTALRKAFRGIRFPYPLGYRGKLLVDLTYSVIKKSLMALKPSSMAHKFHTLRCHHEHRPLLSKLIKGNRILILGPGPSELQWDWIPSDIKLFTCHAGIKTVTDLCVTKRIDLLFCSTAKLMRTPGIKSQIVHSGVANLITDDPGLFRNDPTLLSACSHILFDDINNNYYFNQVIWPLHFNQFRGKGNPYTLSPIRLLQYALFYGAKEVYLAGFDLGHKGNVKLKSSDHQRNINETFIRYVGKQFPNVHSISQGSLANGYIPYRDPRTLTADLPDKKEKLSAVTENSSINNHLPNRTIQESR